MDYWLNFILSIGSGLLLIVEKLKPLILEGIQIISEEIPQLIRRAIQAILYAAVAFLTINILQIIGLTEYKEPALAYAGLMGGGIWGFASRLSKKFIQSDPPTS